MSPRRTDHLVGFRPEEEIAGITVDLRRAGSVYAEPFFNVVTFFNSFFRPRVTLHLVEGHAGPPYVTYTPHTLHIDRELVDLADRGEPEARFIFAHEIGHLALHSHYATAFSAVGAAKIKYAQKEESAEWQANIFAGHFLVPTSIALTLGNVEEIARRCGVMKQLARERLKASRPKLSGDFCANCLNLCSGPGPYCSVACQQAHEKRPKP